jgi:hypothetical protein
MQPDGGRPNVTWQPASQVGFAAIGVRLAAWPDACCRWPVDTAVRSERLTVCRVRDGPELYGKIMRIDDDPSTLFVGAPARTGQEGGCGYVGRAGLGRGITATTSEANPAQCALIRTTPSRMKMVISGSRAMSADTVRLPATGASCVNICSPYQSIRSTGLG